MGMKDGSVEAAVLKVYKDAGGLIDIDNAETYSDIEFRRTGCLALDWVMGNHSTKGGLPRGKIVEFYGPSENGKTTTATIISVSVQGYKTRNQVGCCDLEGKYNVGYGKDLKLRGDRYTLSRPKGKNRGEAGGKTMLGWLDEDDCGLVVWDSFPATISKEQSQGELTDANIGKKAMLQTRIIETMIGKLDDDGPTVVVINQIRKNIGGYGAPTSSSGADALKFYSISRNEVKCVEKLKDGDKTIGITIQYKNIKNQASRPYLTEKTDMYFGQGFDNIKWCIEKAIDLKVITKKGSLYTLTHLPREQMKMTQLTEFFSDKKELNKLYTVCVEVNNSIQEALSKERLSKRGAASREEADF